MSMEAQEEAMAATHSSGSANNNDFSHHSIVKGKRTKRPRLLQAPAPASSASSSGDQYLSGSTTTEEEEDMANCLILLARGRAWDARKRSMEPRLEEDAPAAANGGDQKLSSRNTYECKTCSKCFPSFQALGGHRASHKRPKMSLGPVATEEKKPMEEDILQTSISSYPKITTTNSNRDINNTTTPTFYNNNNTAHHDKPRVHECSICGSEFSSGQALGGHMRRHRPAMMTVPEPREAKKEKSILSLDLNLPAPSDDERGDFPTSPSFALAVGKPPSTVFSASALVDCHY